jgi:hypothetical protein
VAAFSGNVIGRGTALKELKASAEETGIWSSIEDKDIKEAEAEGPPDPMGDQMEMMQAQSEMQSDEDSEAKPGKSKNGKSGKPGGGNSKPKPKSATKDDGGLSTAAPYDLTESGQSETNPENLRALAEEGFHERLNVGRGVAV